MLNGRIYYVCYYIYNFKKKFKNSSSKINKFCKLSFLSYIMIYLSL